MSNKFRILKTLLCVFLVTALAIAFAGCKDKTEKQTEKISGKLFSDRHIEEKYKDPDGKVAFKVDYILPELDEKENQRYSAFNRIMDAIESESQSNAKTVIANKLFEKGKPWKETGGYTVPYASYRYVSVLIEIQREASSGSVSTNYTPVTFALDDCKQCSLSQFAKVSSDYLQTQLAKALMSKISESGGSAPELAAVRSSFDLTSFIFTPDGFTIYFTNSSISGFSGIEECYDFTFDEVSNLLQLPNQPTKQ
ncbi:MAG: hypothetical protein IJK60_11630 [Clostridia bacterium]|nr:hypothetical protein [Clostridia bacterium]